MVGFLSAGKLILVHMWATILCGRKFRKMIQIKFPLCISWKHKREYGVRGMDQSIMYLWQFIIWKVELLNQTVFCHFFYAGDSTQLHSFRFSALDKGELSALRSSCFNPAKISPFTLSIGDKMYPDWVWRFSVGEKLVPLYMW